MSVVLYNTKNFDQYMIEIMKFSKISREEIHECYRKCEETGDKSHLQPIILGNLRFVVYCARKYCGGYQVPLPDLVQEGNIGLLNAVEKFKWDDPKLNKIEFTSFAICHIKQMLFDYVIRYQDTIKKFSSKPHRKLFFNRKLFSKYKSPLSLDSIQEIAKELNISCKDVKEYEARHYSQNLIIEENIDVDDQNSIQLADSNSDPLDILIQDENIINWNELVECLDDRKADIISKRYLIDKKWTLDQLSQTYNISKERIRQLEVQAINQMKIAYNSK